MSDPQRYDLVGDRGVAFDERIEVLGEDWTAATLLMQVRPNADAGPDPAPPIFDLSRGAGIFVLYAGSMTVAGHIASGRLSPDIYDVEKDDSGAKYLAGDTVAVSVIQIGTDDAAMRGIPDGPIPYPPELGDDWVGFYDMLVSRDGVVSARKEFFGEFRVRGTDTQ